jgi:hypothetical protein
MTVAITELPNFFKLQSNVFKIGLKHGACWRDKTAFRASMQCDGKGGNTS